MSFLVFHIWPLFVIFYFITAEMSIMCFKMVLKRFHVMQSWIILNRFSPRDPLHDAATSWGCHQHSKSRTHTCSQARTQVCFLSMPWFFLLTHTQTSFKTMPTLTHRFLLTLNPGWPLIRTLWFLESFDAWSGKRSAPWSGLCHNFWSH